MLTMKLKRVAEPGSSLNGLIETGGRVSSYTTPSADHGFALKLFFPVVVPGGKNSSMKFNCSGFMQKLIFIRHVKRKCFR